MNRRFAKMGQIVLTAVLITAFAAVGAFAGDRAVGSPILKGGMSLSDMKNAKPMPLPKADPMVINSAAGEGAVEYSGEPTFEKGSRGNGIMTPVTIPMPMAEDAADGDEVSVQAYGTKNHPFTTSRVDMMGVRNVSGLYPFRAAGKLYFKFGQNNYICSASLIKKGLILTAAHCVIEWGQGWTNGGHTNFTYVPALFGSTAPYGTWSVTQVYAMNGYVNGTDTCAQAGVICNDDIAVMVVTPQNTAYPGTQTGWFGYGTNGYGFTNTANPLALINQLGYPGSHDSGVKMQRTDSQGYKDPSLANNTMWGSRQTGGSSGGPELVNLGAAAVLDTTATLGSEANWNTVVGVTSWGYTDKALKQQGASPFLSGTNGNIDKLVSAACTAYPAACAP